MDDLIAGMKYYCSDVSEEKARGYSKDKKYAPHTWDGTWFVSSSGYKLLWDYWIRADDNPMQQVVTFPYTPGKKYLFKNYGGMCSPIRIYVCTIGERHYSVLGGQEDNYPNGQFEIFPWDKVIEIDDVTEMTMEQVASELREKGVITGTLKIKE